MTRELAGLRRPFLRPAISSGGREAAAKTQLQMMEGRGDKEGYLENIMLGSVPIWRIRTKRGREHKEEHLSVLLCASRQ